MWMLVLPWAVLGSLAVLAPIAFFMAANSINKDKENMTRLLVEKGGALIRSFEAGARTGMMGMGWSGMQVQRLLVETAREPGIVYLAVTDERGRAVAHSDPQRIGKVHHELNAEVVLESEDDEKWQRVRMKDGTSVFEVYRAFSPIGITHARKTLRGRGMIMSRTQSWEWERFDGPFGNNGANQGDWCRFYWNPPQGPRRPVHFIFVGLEVAPLESARAEATRNTLMMSAGVLFAGLAGMVSLFLAQGYKLARRSLAEVQAYSDQVVGHLPMGLVATNEKGCVAAFNDTAETILGKYHTYVIGESAEDALPSELWQLSGELKNKNTIVEQDMECKVGANAAVPLRVSASVVRREGGAFLGYVFIFRDLTEVRRLEQEVKRSQRLAAVGRLAAGVAHEIRNPLSSIKGFATYFKEKLRDAPEDQETARIMIQEVERLDRVIGQLLEFARPSQLSTAPVRVADLVRHSLKLIEGDARSRGVELASFVPDDLPEINVDADRMSQVLLNLYLNAIQAMEDGGTMTIEVSRNETKKSTVISIGDDGPGIPAQDRERIFDPYFTTKADGTGLGLAIVHKIVEAHGGEIDIESDPGRGTKVSVVLMDRGREDDGRV